MIGQTPFLRDVSLYFDPLLIFLDRIPPLSYPRMPIVELLNAAHK